MDMTIQLWLGQPQRSSRTRLVILTHGIRIWVILSASIHLFYLHWHAAKLFLPVIPYQHLAKRMGVAPGFRMPLRLTAKLAQRLVYGSPESSLLDKSKTLSDLNRFLLRKTNHTGSDIRVISGDIYNSKAFPRQSIAADWWSWEHAFARPWKRRAHINVLELETILWGIKFQVENLHLSDARIFQVTDSYICISVVSKGRSSSKQLQRVLRKISALLLAHGLFLIIAHVESTENPTDAMSRSL